MTYEYHSILIKYPLQLTGGSNWSEIKLTYVNNQCVPFVKTCSHCQVNSMLYFKMIALRLMDIKWNLEIYANIMLTDQSNPFSFASILVTRFFQLVLY